VDLGKSFYVFQLPMDDVRGLKKYLVVPSVLEGRSSSLRAPLLIPVLCTERPQRDPRSLTSTLKEMLMSFIGTQRRDQRNPRQMKV
jgi:hypothetical protein